MNINFRYVVNQMNPPSHTIKKYSKALPAAAFRSHAGILGCAGGFLDLLFAYFPGSAKQLKKDFGLFKGSRPGVFSNIQLEQLSVLLKEKTQGMVVLTHDESASQWRETLDYPLVYGIREAKVWTFRITFFCTLPRAVLMLHHTQGLEFPSVIILDFFSELPLQKPWRNLLLGREDTSDFELRYPLIETHLKLVYTAVTRSIEQLFFAESRESIAGTAAMRWLTSSNHTSGQESALATRNNVADIDSNDSVIMTNDEFCIVGIDNAQLAESDEIEMAQSMSYLERSIYCFGKAQNLDLEAKARTNLKSVQLRNDLSKMPSLDQSSIEALERTVAEMTQSLLTEELFSECVKLLSIFMPFLSEYTQEKLGENIISKIQNTMHA